MDTNINRGAKFFISFCFKNESRLVKRCHKSSEMLKSYVQAITFLEFNGTIASINIFGLPLLIDNNGRQNLRHRWACKRIICQQAHAEKELALLAPFFHW